LFLDDCRNLRTLLLKGGRAHVDEKAYKSEVRWRGNYEKRDTTKQTTWVAIYRPSTIAEHNNRLTRVLTTEDEHPGRKV